MAKKTVGDLIRDARKKAGFTQQSLAAMVGGLSAQDLGKAERGEKNLTMEQLKRIARITGVTQKSLLDAAAEGKKADASSKTLTVTAAEKKLVELYRAADSDTKKKAVAILKGDQTSGAADLLSGLFGSNILSGLGLREGEMPGEDE